MDMQPNLDLRTVERVRVSCQAELVLDSRSDPLSCAVLDVSRQGARISLREPARLPNATSFLFVRNGEAIEADVAWQLGFDVGLRFREAGPAAVMHAA